MITTRFCRSTCDLATAAGPRCVARRRVLRAAACCALLAGVSSLATPHARAQNVVTFAQGSIQPNGANLRMPFNRATSRDSGLSLSIDTRWANNYGYRPIQVIVNSPTPTTADHLVTIRLRAGWWARRWGEITVEQDLELPMGSTSAEALVACPQYHLAVQYFSWDVWVDGVKDEDLSMDRTLAMTTMAGSMSPGATSPYTMLVIGPASKKRQILNPGSSDVEVLALGVSDLPPRWIDYTCLDVVSVSPDELRRLASSNPDALTALRRWVQAGGGLWVEQVGTEWEELPSVEQVLQLPSPSEMEQGQKTAQVDAGGAVPARGWEPVEFRRNRRRRAESFVELSTGEVQRVRDPDIIARLQNDPNFAPLNPRQGPSGEVNSDAELPEDSSRWFLQKPLGLGYVRAFSRPWDDPALAVARRSTTAPQPDVDSTMTFRLSAALQATRDWSGRHGLVPDEANRNFSNLLVPGVGLAPVTEFRVLITLFVLVIGPLNYWLLKRSQRVHLMVLTVPAAAGIVTLALFAYALLSDGLGTTVRVRSYTTLDERTGEAACWARLSYYSGLAPRRGLNLPDDVVVYPIIPGWDETDDGSTFMAHRAMEWGDRNARLAVGWLNSRTPTQYLSIRSRRSPHGLHLASAGNVLKATNELGTDLIYVVVLDDAGNVFTGEQIAAGSATRLLPTPHSEALGRWRRIVLENDPESPAALVDPDSDFFRAQRRRQRRTMQQLYGRLDYSDQQLTTNLPNDAIADLAGLEDRPGLRLPPRSYVAVTETGPEVELGVAGATQQASFHVLVGRW